MFWLYKGNVRKNRLHARRGMNGAEQEAEFFMFPGNYSGLINRFWLVMSNVLTANTMFLRETSHELPILMKLLQVGRLENEFSVLLKNISAPKSTCPRPCREKHGQVY